MIKNPIDRPFRSREEMESEQALVAQYRQIGNAELLAAYEYDARSERAESADQ